jgi:CO/xanthine dehydrogenase Mo-binding subunit
MRVTGLPSSAVTVHTLPLGGGFGRKAESDFAEQAVRVSQAIGRPVKVIWSREEGIRHDFYRSASRTMMAAGVDAEGNLAGWVGRCATKSILFDCSWGGPDGSCWDLWGFDGSLPYRIPNMSVQFQHVDYRVRIGWMRGVGYSRNTFSVESFIDELAHAAAMDPVEFRLRNLENQRVRAAVQRVAELANWGSPAVAGAAHGVALMEHRGTTVAAVAEVSIGPGGRVVVHTFYVVIDCGQVINPDNVRAQMEGGVVFGMSTGLFGEITMQEGAVVQSNFHDYPLLKLGDCPEVVVDVVDSAESPSGVGEHAVGVVAPAVTNALFRLTGERIRSLPISTHV